MASAVTSEPIGGNLLWSGKNDMKVLLFVTCLVDQLFPQVGLSSVRILEKFGMDVIFDPRQTCCGQPAFNSGFKQEAAEVARNLLDVFREPHPVVVPSGSCCTMIRVFLPELFPEGSPEREQAEQIASRTYELSDFLVSELGIEKTGARFPEAVTYHDSCHLLRELGISSQPRRLIRAVEGIDFREMEESSRCCGFGGTFSVKFAAVSAAIGEDKLRWIRDSGARYVVASDVGCLMHIDGLLRRHNLPVRVLHLAELLANFDDQD